MPGRGTLLDLEKLAAAVLLYVFDIAFQAYIFQDLEQMDVRGRKVNMVLKGFACFNV